jgi:hypothetical protein
LADSPFNFPETLLTLEILKEIPLALPTVRFTGAIVEEQLREARSVMHEPTYLGSLIDLLSRIEYEATQFVQQFPDDRSDPTFLEDFTLDQEKLSEKLKNLPFCLTLALWDATERYDPSFWFEMTGESELDYELRYNGAWRPRSHLTQTFAQNCEALKELHTYLIRNKEAERRSRSSGTPSTEEE